MQNCTCTVPVPRWKETAPTRVIRWESRLRRMDGHTTMVPVVAPTVYIYSMKCSTTGSMEYWRHTLTNNRILWESLLASEKKLKFSCVRSKKSHEWERFFLADGTNITTAWSLYQVQVLSPPTQVQSVHALHPSLLERAGTSSTCCTVLAIVVSVRFFHWFASFY